MEYLTYLYMEHEKRPICTAWYIDIRVRGNHLNAITAGRGGQSFQDHTSRPQHRVQHVHVGRSHRRTRY